MPKESRERSVSRASPYPSGSGCSKHSLPINPLESEDNAKEWEDARCPVCMEHPHNAILLLCASHEKGCRPFMCDTSYRHSNCFDQFKKSFGEASTTPVQEDPVSASSPVFNPSSPVYVPESPVYAPESPLTGSTVQRLLGASSSVQEDVSCDDDVNPKLACPLCRQDIKGWMVVESARGFMNAKLRSCASETCEFSGTYRELRKHAREAHPLVRPTDADPERQRSWRRLEQQRDLGDLLSTLQSSLGDETNEDGPLSVDGHILTVVFLVRILHSGGASSRSSSWSSSSGTSSTRAQVITHHHSSRRLWGETRGRESSDSRDDNNETSDAATAVPPQGNRGTRARRRSAPDN